MHALLVQTNIAWENKQANLAAVERLIRDARPSPRDLIVLPEMFDTGFSTNLAATVDADGRTLDFLCALAGSTGAYVHGARTLINPDGTGRNVATIIDPAGRLICEYAKMHLFPLGTPAEASRFAPGPGVTTYAWTHTHPDSVMRVCPTICYDLRFPELFRMGLDLGAEVFTVTSSWPVAREEHRRTLSIARAIENQAYVLSVNRCGRDPHLEYAGGTLAIDPRGEVLGQLGGDEGVLKVEIDPREVRRWREVFPAWRNRRPITPMPG